MTAPDVHPVDLPAGASSPERPPDTCDACAHLLREHDALGVRFCAATTATALTRGCICR